MTLKALFFFMMSSFLSSAMAACPGGSTCVPGSTWVATNAALKAVATATAAQMTNVYRAGYYATGDGGDAFYTWNAGSSCTDDGGSCIIPNSAPGTGRWILNLNGASSVKAFGAVCDGSTNDIAAFNAALAARSAVYVPSGTVCAIHLASSSGGLQLSDLQHLYGENQYTSRINVYLDFTPSYDFVAGGRLTSIVVLSNVGTVTTGWSHEMAVGQTVTIAGSATSALNGTYTIASITAPDKFTIATSGVGNGTYTDPTSLVGPSGIGTTVIRAANRDDGNPNNFTRAEIDHLSFLPNPIKPFTWIDMTGMWSTRVHDVSFLSGAEMVASGQVGIVCADRTPAGASKACFFNHVYDIFGAFQTFLHWSAHDGNSGDNLFERFSGSARVGLDATGTLNGSMGGLVSEWYLSGDSDPNSWNIYNAPQETVYQIVGSENYTHFAPFNVDKFAYLPSTSNIFVNLPGIRMLSPTGVGSLPTCTAGIAGSLYLVNDATSPAYNTAITGGGGVTIVALCNGSAWVAH